MIYRILVARPTTKLDYVHEVEIMALPWEWLARAVAFVIWPLLRFRGALDVLVESSTPDNALVEWGEYRRES